MTYIVTKLFTSGKLAGQSVSEKTIVPFKVGTCYQSINKRGAYLVTNLKKI